MCASRPREVRLREHELQSDRIHVWWQLMDWKCFSKVSQHNEQSTQKWSWQGESDCLIENKALWLPQMVWILPSALNVKVMKFKQALVKRREQLWFSQGTQMPHHPISGAHERVNKITTVTIYNLAKSQARERAWDNQWRKKTLLSLILVRLCEVT